MKHTISDTQSEITHILIEPDFAVGPPRVHHVIYRTVITESEEPPQLSHSNWLGWQLYNSTSEKVRQEDDEIIFELYTHVFIQWLD